MSSEQRYDYSYGHFVQDNLPNLELFGDPAITATVNASSDGFQDESQFLANFPQGDQISGNPYIGAQGRSLETEGDPFGNFDFEHETYDPAPDFDVAGDATGNPDFDMFAPSQLSASSAFSPLDLTTTAFADAAQLPIDAGEFLYRNDAFLPFARTATCDQAGSYGVGVTQTHLQGAQSGGLPDLARPNEDVTQGADMRGPQTDPINNSALSERLVAWRQEADSAGSPNDNMSRITERTIVSALDHIPHLDRSGESHRHRPQTCHWRDCSSKAIFHSRSALKAHERNMHITPLVCKVPGCHYKKPFGKPCDLKRHEAAKHGGGPGYLCREHGCGQIFSRNDKLIKHTREKHQLFKCPYNHCSAVVIAGQTEIHLEEEHGGFECAVASCKFSAKSHFTEQKIRRHLHTGHGMGYNTVYARVREAYHGNQIAHAEKREAVDCKSCASKSRDKQQ